MRPDKTQTDTPLAPRPAQPYIRLDDGQVTDAVCYIADRKHEQYAGNLDAAHAAGIVVGAVGQSGRNEDYVASTVEHLKALGIRDHWLEEVARLIAN